MWPVGQAVKTAASHAANGSSILPRVTKKVLTNYNGYVIVKKAAEGSRIWYFLSGER